MEYKIYCLKDPDTNEIRYIGYTYMSLEVRLKLHIVKATSKYSKINHNYTWIRSLLKNSKYPIIEYIDSAKSLKDIWLLEIHYIKLYKDNNYNLTNGTIGGEGGKRCPINQFDKFGNFIKSFNSILEASYELKLSDSHITSNCKGKRLTVGGFVFRYETDNFNKYPIKCDYSHNKTEDFRKNISLKLKGNVNGKSNKGKTRPNNYKPHYLYTLNDEFIKEYPSLNALYNDYKKGNFQTKNNIKYSKKLNLKIIKKI